MSDPALFYCPKGGRMIRFSKSKLNTFWSCPEKYYLFNELGLRSPKSSPTLVEGSCIHHLVEDEG